MKKTNKKGFTIVELVIVIAVIAILSAVLIPTFGGVIEDANKTTAQQEARNLYTAFIQECTDDKGEDDKITTANLDDDICFKVDDYWFNVVDGQLSGAMELADNAEPTGKGDEIGTVNGTSVYGYTATATNAQ